MITSNDLNCLPVFAPLKSEDREYFARKAADVRLLPNEWLIHEREPSSFYVLLEGSVEMFKDLNGRQEMIVSRGPCTFSGELPILLGAPSLVWVRAKESCRIARLDRQQLQELIRDFPKFGESIFSTMTERFAMAQEYAKETPSARVTIQEQELHTLWQSLRSFLFAINVPYECYAEKALDDDFSTEPSISVHVDGAPVSSPLTIRKVAEALKLQTEPQRDFYDDVIVGAGPAGMAAAVYASSEGLSTLVVERFAAGGQAGTSSRIENYLGSPGGISGDDLSGRALKHPRRRQWSNKIRMGIGNAL